MSKELTVRTKLILILGSLLGFFVVWLIAVLNNRLEIEIIDSEGKAVAGVTVKAKFSSGIDADFLLFKNLETTNEDGMVKWEQPAVGNLSIIVGSKQVAESDDEATGISYEANIRSFLGIVVTRKLQFIYTPE